MNEGNKENNQKIGCPPLSTVIPISCPNNLSLAFISISVSSSTNREEERGAELTSACLSFHQKKAH